MTMTMMKTVEKEENKQPSQTTQEATMTTTTTTTNTSNAVGERMIAALEGLLLGIQSQNLTVHEKDVAVVNRCFGCGNNTAVECRHGTTTHDVTQSQIYAALQGFLQTLKNDPTKRHFIVDQDCSTQTEDAIWLSIPKWQYDICRHHHHQTATQTTTTSSSTSKMTTKTAVAVAQLQCVVTTVRSLERSVFYQCYNSSTSTGNWKVQEGTGPRGSAMITLLDTSTSAPETTTSTETSSSCPFGGIQAVFSDQPRHVAYMGRLLSKLSAQQQGGEEEKKKAKNGDVILRVFRCAPRPSLQQGIANVLVQQTSDDIHGDNVFDLWIRHVEIPENLPGMGTFVHSLDKSSSSSSNNNVSLLQLLTEVHVPKSLDNDHDGNKLAKSLDFVVASTMNPVSVNRTSRAAASSSSSTDASPPALVQDDEEEEKEEEPAAPLCASVAATTPAPRTIEPLNTIHDGNDAHVNASNQQQPSSLQTPAAAFAPNEFSNQALLSQQQHPSLVTPLVSMAAAAAATSSDYPNSSELYQNNDDPTPTMLVLDEEEEEEEALLTSPPRSSAGTGMANDKVVDSPTSTSGSEMDSEKHEDGCNEPNVSGSASKKDATESQAMNDDDDDVLGGGGGGGDVATTTTMASTNKDPSIASDEDDNDAPPPVTSVETTTLTEPKDARKNKQNKKAPSKKAAQQNKVAEKSSTNADKKQKQGGGKKKVPTKDDKEASAGTQQTKNGKALDSTSASRDAPRKNENNEMTKDMSKVVATNNDVPVSTINNSCSSLPPHENTKTVTEKKNPAAVVPNHNNNNAQRHVVGPICKACNLHKPKSEFSAAQLKKKDKRCKDCIQTNRFVQSENK